MQEQQRRRISVGAIAGVSALVLATAGATAFLTLQSQKTEPPKPVPTSTVPSLSETPSVPIDVAPPDSQPSPVPIEVAPPTKSTTPPIESAPQQKVPIYLLKDNGTKTELVPKQVPVQATNNPSLLLTAAFNSLFSVASASTTFSAIPPRTKLQSLTVKDDGVHIDLSSEFTMGGGSASMTGRVAQILYTATSLDPNAQVWISVEGKPLEVLGGEGLEIPQPLTQKNFVDSVVLP